MQEIARALEPSGKPGRVAVPTTERSESLVSRADLEADGESTPADYAPLKDREHSERIQVAATGSEALGDYGAAPD